MGVVNLLGSRIMTGLAAVPATLADPGEGGGRLKRWVETVEVGSADSATSTYTLAKIPSSARLMGGWVFWDDLASTGAPTLDFGVKPVNSEFTADADAINDGLDAATVNTAGKALIKDPANIGKRVWEFINGVTVDPKCDVYVYASLLDADVNVGGTLTAAIDFAMD